MKLTSSLLMSLHLQREAQGPRWGASPAPPGAAGALPGAHRFLLGDSLRASPFFSWRYIRAALSYSRFRFP